MEKKDGVTSRILSYFFRHSNQLISTILVGSNIALVVYGVLLARLIESYLSNGIIENQFVLVLTQIVIATLVILVTGEFLPRVLFKNNSNLMLKVFAVPLFVCYVILFPISKFVSGLSRIFLWLTGMKINREASDKAFGKVDLDNFVQTGIENAANEEELDTEIEVGDYLETVEYDYPNFHLSMDCFFCMIKMGDLVLREHEAAKWLTVETLDDVDWLPADKVLIEQIKRYLRNH